MNSYSHLKIQVSKEFYKKIKLGYPLNKLSRFYIHFYFITKFLSGFKIIRKIARQIIYFYQYNNTVNRKTLRSIELLKKKHSVKANDFNSEFGYEDEFEEIQSLVSYAKQLKDNFPGQSESKQLYSSIEEIYPSIINKYKINNFINFGSLYSHIDSELAKKFPQTNFICANRSTYTKIINNKMFGHIKNITFVDGDVLDFLENNKFDNDLFFSARTYDLLPKEFIETLFQSVYRSGFKYISFIDIIGISHQTMECYNFSDDDKPSVAYRGGMYLHNYPGILRKFGYRVVESKLIKTDHPFEDLRFIFILSAIN